MDQIRAARRRPGLLLAAGALSLALVAAACGGDDSSNTTETTAAGTTVAGDTSTTVAETTTTAAMKPVSGGKVSIGVEAETTGAWDPANMQCDAPCQLKARAFFEPLTSVGDDGTVKGYLADSITSDDGMLWTITLRDGVTFSDGTPMDADSVAKSLRYARTGFIVGQALKPIADGDDAIKVVDPKTVTVQMKTVWWDFPYIMTTQAGFISSGAWLDVIKGTDDAATAAKVKPVATGPFVVDSYTPGNNLIVKKNPNYWQKDADGTQLPYLDEIEFKVVADSQSRASGLEAGDLDVIHTTNGESIAKFRKEADKFPMVEWTRYGETSYLLMNLGQGDALSDQRVRCGLTAAVDKQGVIDALQAGVNKAANGPFSPEQPGYLEDNGAQGYDPAKAKELISAYTAEKGKPKVIFTTTNDASALQGAQIYQAAWQDAGVDVEIQQVEQGKLITNALTGDKNFNIFGWRNHAGFLDNQYIWWHGTQATPPPGFALNFGRLKDPVIDKALDDNRATKDEAVKKQLAEDVNREFAKQCWIIPLYWTIWGIVSNPKVHGVQDLEFPGTTDKVAIGQGFPGQFHLTKMWVSPS